MSDDAFDDEVAAVTFDRDDESVVVIVGSGAGGGTLAHELCAKGIDVVLLEAGPRYRLTDFDNDEYVMQAKLNWSDRRIVQGNGRIARDWPDSPTLVVKAVGGSTIHWAAVALRGHPDEFRPSQRLWCDRRRRPDRLAPRLRGISSPTTRERRTSSASPAPTPSRTCRPTTTSV